MNEGFGTAFYRKGNSVKRSGPFSEPPDSPQPIPKMSSEDFKSVRSYLRKVFLRRPRIMDICANLYFPCSERWAEVFGPRRPPPWVSACLRDIPPKNFLFLWAALPFLTIHGMGSQSING